MGLVITGKNVVHGNHNLALDLLGLVERVFLVSCGGLILHCNVGNLLSTKLDFRVPRG